MNERDSLKAILDEIESNSGLINATNPPVQRVINIISRTKRIATEALSKDTTNAKNAI